MKTTLTLLIFFTLFSLSTFAPRFAAHRPQRAYGLGP